MVRSHWLGLLLTRQYFYSIEVNNCYFPLRWEAASSPGAQGASDWGGVRCQTCARSASSSNMRLYLNMSSTRPSPTTTPPSSWQPAARLTCVGSGTSLWWATGLRMDLLALGNTVCSPSLILPSCVLPLYWRGRAARWRGWTECFWRPLKRGGKQRKV